MKDYTIVCGPWIQYGKRSFFCFFRFPEELKNYKSFKIKRLARPVEPKFAGMIEEMRGLKGITEVLVFRDHIQVQCCSVKAGLYAMIKEIIARHIPEAEFMFLDKGDY